MTSDSVDLDAIVAARLQFALIPENLRGTGHGLHRTARAWLVGLFLLMAPLGACTGDRATEAPRSAIDRALAEFSSEYGAVASHSAPSTWRQGQFRVFVRGRFTVTGPLARRGRGPYVAHYTSGWIGFDARGNVLEVSLGSG